MKKSEIYRMAQIAVLNSHIGNLDTLEVLRELMKEEDLALLCEKQEAKENAHGESV